MGPQVRHYHTRGTVPDSIEGKGSCKGNPTTGLARTSPSKGLHASRADKPRRPTRELLKDTHQERWQKRSFSWSTSSFARNITLLRLFWQCLQALFHPGCRRFLRSGKLPTRGSVTSFKATSVPGNVLTAGMKDGEESRPSLSMAASGQKRRKSPRRAR